jgi:hypothetical protein
MYTLQYFMRFPALFFLFDNYLTSSFIREEQSEPPLIALSFAFYFLPCLFPYILDRFLNCSLATKRYRLSWLTNSALVYEPKCEGEGGSCGVPANEYSCTQEPKLTYKF